MLVEEFGTWLKELCTSTLAQKDTTERNGDSLDTSEARLDGSIVSCQIGDAESLEQPTRSSEKNGQRVKRTILWSHHLLATSKRKDIVNWSRELRLGGYSRPGYPGAIFVEGELESVDEFVRRIKGLRWQALQVRAEETGSLRVFGDGMEGVLEVESLGEVVDGLRRRDEGVARMFLEGMKISH